jgi:Bacterial Ig-like domain (group 3)
MLARWLAVGRLACVLIAVSCGVGVASSQAADGPVNTAPPTISGTTTQGQTLTENNGTWDSSVVPPFTYQWEDCDNTGAGCAAIPGATDQAYLLTSNDVGHTIVVQETATNATGSTVASSTATAVVVVPALPVPANTAPPTISGTTTQGQTLNEANGTWTNNPVPPFTYQWEDCDNTGAGCAAIPGAINQTYLLTSNDVGHTIVVQETATNATGPTVASSAPTAVVAGAPVPAPASTAPPTISGTTTQGQTLNEANGTWTNNPVPPFTYQWEDCNSAGAACAPISGATGQTYTLVATDVGHTIVVQETATNATGSTVASSAATAVVAPPIVVAVAPANTEPPTISGTTTQGQTLTEANGTWTNNPVPPFTYQWEDCNAAGAACAPISGATGQTYTLVAADVGHTIVVQETATNATGSTVASSSATAVVAAPALLAPANTAPPTISGTTTQGQTLTETNGTWTNSPVPPFTYQWEDCNAAGAGCTAIAAAINQTYLLTAGDVGHTIVVQETATNPTGPTVASSAATAVVAPPLVVALPAPASKTPPTISGTATQGQTLTETNGTWDNTPTTVTNQWEDCNSAGAGCTAISGATGQTYPLSAADVGHTIVVQETATNATGPTVASSARTAVVAGPALVPSSTALTAVPNTVVTNEDVVLGATVTSAATPQGTITFNDDGAPISGCAKLPVDSQPTIVTCETSFSASASPEHLTAVFTPGVASGRSSAAASTSSTQLVVIGRDSTSTAVRAPGASVRVGARTTYTASVTPSDIGSVHASGSVAFLDRGTAITSCARQPLLASNGATTATCTVSYKTTGKHVITAAYAGDGNFGGSTAQPVSLGTAPVQVLGTIISTMQWTFHYTPSYTTVLALVVNGAPVGATVLVKCHGGGCPFAKRANAVKKHKPVNLMLSFRRKRLRAGTQITVELSRPHWIGKDYRFTIRARHAPRIQIDCLAPAGSRPGVGC